MVAEAARTDPVQGFFTHVRRNRPPETMTRATRYLCAAAHLDEAFRRTVIGELLDRPHGAVVPSCGFDLGPVLLHSLRARQMRLARDTAICGAMFVAFWINPSVTLAFFCGSGALALAASARWHPGIVAGGLFAGGIAWSASVYVLGRILGADLLNVSGLGTTGIVQETGGHGGIVGWWTDPLGGLLVFLLLFGTVLALGYRHRLRTYRVLRDELRPGAATTEWAGGEHSHNDLGRITGAQLGNVTLYSGENPFIGFGSPGSAWGRTWSIALELDRPEAATDGPGRVDPVELHEHVRRALMAMSEEWPLTEDDRPDDRDPALRQPVNERVPGLSVNYQVIARGLCEQYDRPADTGFNAPIYRGHPLIDPDRGVPFSRATDAAREAIIRHPQAAVRCYQRVTIGAEGQAVRDPAGRIVAPADDQDLLVSAFVYLAVEGRMLYAQFVADVLPPIRRRFRVVDELATCPDAALRRIALFSGLGGAPGVAFRAPFAVAGRLIAGLAEGGKPPAPPVSAMAFDYGARVSVRELAAEPSLPTFTQRLDAHKYLRLVERRLTEALLDYLQGRHVDVSSYRQQMATIINNGVMAGRDINNGQFAVGVSDGHVHLTNVRRSG